MDIICRSLIVLGFVFQNSISVPTAYFYDEIRKITLKYGRYQENEKNSRKTKRTITVLFVSDNYMELAGLV